MNEFRRDPVTGRTVIIAADRDARPNQYVASQVELSSALPHTNVSCQFCAAQMDTPPIVARYGHSAEAKVDDWQVCVVPNLYPSLHDVAPKHSAHGTWTSAPATGVHEVVIESPTHVTRASDLTPTQFELLLWAYRDRVQSILQRPEIRYVQVIKNSGEAAGASIQHTHSQVFGLPFVPKGLREELSGAQQFFDERQQCVYCHTLEQELAAFSSGEEHRIVGQSQNFVAWCPYASRVAYEVHVAPRTHTAQFENTSQERTVELAEFLRSIVRKLDLHPRIDAFNYLIHTLPSAHADTNFYHWHIEIIPRIAKEAGFEWATGVHINTVAPERAAVELSLIEPNL